jgi:hypothetical protein
MTKLEKVYPYNRFLSLVLLGGSVFLLVTDTMPFAFNFRLTFEYGALFYPAIVNLIFTVPAFLTFWKPQLKHEALPMLATSGFVAIFFSIFQAIFTLVALAMYNYDIVVSGSYSFNLLGLCWITFRLYSIVQASLSLLFIKWTYVLHENPGIEQTFLRSLLFGGPKQLNSASQHDATVQSSYTTEKSREEVV